MECKNCKADAGKFDLCRECYKFAKNEYAKEMKK